MIVEKKIHEFAEATIQRIEYLKVNDPDNANLDELKLLLSDIENLLRLCQKYLFSLKAPTLI